MNHILNIRNKIYNKICLIILYTKSKVFSHARCLYKSKSQSYNSKAIEDLRINNNYNNKGI